jgi:hypothetical protein
MKYIRKEYFNENWTYVTRPIENTIFSNFTMGTANLA